MTDNNFRAKLTVQARMLLHELLESALEEGIIHRDDTPFDSAVPGNDPRFHELVKDLVGQTHDFMIDTAMEMIAN